MVYIRDWALITRCYCVGIELLELICIISAQDDKMWIHLLSGQPTWHMKFLKKLCFSNISKIKLIQILPIIRYNTWACMRARSYVTHFKVHVYEKTALLGHSFHMPCMHSLYTLIEQSHVLASMHGLWGNAVGLNWTDSVKCMYACMHVCLHIIYI